jgi:hypothetical protein
LNIIVPYDSFELEGGDWECWIYRFGRILRSLPHLKRVVVSQASQCGCGDFDTHLILPCLHLPELEYLDCSGNECEEGLSAALAQLIRKCPNLKTIQAYECGFEEDDEDNIVLAVKEAAEKGSLGLEKFYGVDLAMYQEVLGLTDSPATADNKELLQHLRDLHSAYQLK